MSFPFSLPSPNYWFFFVFGLVTLRLTIETTSLVFHPFIQSQKASTDLAPFVVFDLQFDFQRQKLDLCLAASKIPPFLDYFRVFFCALHVPFLPSWVAGPKRSRRGRNLWRRRREEELRRAAAFEVVGGSGDPAASPSLICQDWNARVIWLPDDGRERGRSWDREQRRCLELLPP